MPTFKTNIYKRIEPFEITDEHIQYANRCDMLQLVVWFDSSCITKLCDCVVLKSQPDCCVIKEGIYDTRNGHLAPPFIALQKYFNLSILQAYMVCNEFMEKVDKAAIREYCTNVYGLANMPIVPEGMLNYVVDDNILYSDPVALKTLYGILSDVFSIDRDVIAKCVENNLITVDSNFNICFNTLEDGNVVSCLKMSRYNHSNTRFSYNLYVTKRDVGFVYDKYNIETSALTDFDKIDESRISSLTVFDNPIEMLSYLSLEKKACRPAVKQLSDNSCFLAMYNTNIGAVQKYLTFNKVDTLNIAIKLTKHNDKYIKKYFYYYAKKYGVSKVEDQKQQIIDYITNYKFPPNQHGFRIEGWNKLLKIIKNN